MLYIVIFVHIGWVKEERKRLIKYRAIILITIKQVLSVLSSNNSTPSNRCSIATFWFYELPIWCWISRWTLSFTQNMYIMQYIYIMCGIWSVSTKYAREWKRHSSGTNFMVESNAVISERLILCYTRRDNVCEKAKIWYYWIVSSHQK